MSAGKPRFLFIAAAALALSSVVLGGCDLIPGQGSGFRLDKDRFEAALDPKVGGPDTCMVIKDVERGSELYRYGAESVCNRPLAPCETFEVPLAVIGLSDGKVQPYKAWERDMDLNAAWRADARWWFQRLAVAIGPERFRRALPSFGYGQGKPVGRPDAFWMGPAAGGGLYLSTRNQADVLRKLARTALPAKPGAQGTVQGLMADQVRGSTQLYDLGATCPSIADSSRDVSWWVGRIKAPKSDVVFALSIESANPLSGREIRSRMLPILTNAGLLPSA